MKFDVKALREDFHSQVTALDARLDTLTDPLQSQSAARRDQFNQLPSRLAPSEEAAAADRIGFGLDALANGSELANAVIGKLPGMPQPQ